MSDLSGSIIHHEFLECAACCDNKKELECCDNMKASRAGIAIKCQDKLITACVASNEVLFAEQNMGCPGLVRSGTPACP